MKKYNFKSQLNVSKYFYSLAISSSFFFTSCAKQVNSSSSEWIKPAPQTQSEAGTMVRFAENNPLSQEDAEIAKKQIQDVSTQNGWNVREVSFIHGIYEIYTKDIESVKNQFSNSVTVIENEVIQFDQAETFNSKLNTLQKNKLFSRIGASQAGETKQTPCVGEDKTSTILVTGKFGSRNYPNGGVADLSYLNNIGVSLQIAGQTPEGTVFGFVTFGPKDSKYEKGLSSPGVTFKLNPDLPGRYDVFALSKTKEGLCTQTMFSIGATYNQIFGGIKEARIPTVAELTAYTQIAATRTSQAWTLGNKGEGVKIAVLDSGVNYNHPDLAPNILYKSTETVGSREDTDSNGFPGDAVGWDFVMNDSMPIDDAGHGTHVAGLIAGSIGGIAPSAKILPVKVMSAMGSGDLASIEAGIRYAVDSGANILNLSLGGGTKGFEKVYAALQYAESKGVAIVCASGNEKANIDVTPSFPASLPIRSLIVVGATDLFGSLAPYSNFGPNTVHVAAPGGVVQVAPNETAKIDGGLWSTSYLPGIRPYIQFSGTSMASPIVAGIVALMKSSKPTLTGYQLKLALLQTASGFQALNGKIQSSRFVNAEAAVQFVKALP